VENINDILEPLKVQSALKSELMKLNFRKEHKPKDINILDYTIIESLEKQIPKKINNLDCCPICNTYGKDDNGIEGEYCPNCGQRLDWD